MTEETMKEVIGKIISKPPCEIQMNQSFRGDLKMDSLQALDLLVTLEEDHRILIDQAEAAHLRTPSDLLQRIQEKANLEAR